MMFSLKYLKQSIKIIEEKIYGFESITLAALDELKFLLSINLRT